jgi:hypothetical protein
MPTGISLLGKLGLASPLFPGSGIVGGAPLSPFFAFI